MEMLQCRHHKFSYAPYRISSGNDSSPSQEDNVLQDGNEVRCINAESQMGNEICMVSEVRPRVVRRNA